MSSSRHKQVKNSIYTQYVYYPLQLSRYEHINTCSVHILSMGCIENYQSYVIVIEVYRVNYLMILTMLRWRLLEKKDQNVII